MRTLLYYLFFLLVVLSISSCDYVDNPFPVVSNHGDTTSCPKPTFPTTTSTLRNVLIEDYTGHTCVNCPKGADTLKEIIADYPGRVVGIGVHFTSTYAAPKSGFNGTTPPAYMSDYRTDAGNTYGSLFKTNSLPTGLVSRKDYSASASTQLKSYWNPPSWRDHAIAVMGKPAIANIKMINNYNGGDSLCINVRTTFLKDTSGTYNLIILLTQDSIIDWQYDGRKNPKDVEEYIHRHVLRTSITTPWGDLMASGTIAKNYYVDDRYKIHIKPSYNNIPCKIEHCHIVAFLYDANTYEVMQVVEEKVK